MARFAASRDRHDHFRFAPVQTRLGRDLCRAHGVPTETLSTAVLFDAGIRDNNNNNGDDDDGGGSSPPCCFTYSESFLRLLYPHLNRPWPQLAFLVLKLVPRVIRDPAYRLIFRHRHRIWKRLVKVGTIGDDTSMRPYRDKMVGLEDEDHDGDARNPLPASWEFGETVDEEIKNE